MANTRFKAENGLLVQSGNSEFLTTSLFNANATVNASLQVVNTVSFANTLQVTGDVNFLGNLTVAGNLSAATVGFTGSQGAIGYTGSRGATGFTGSQGAGFTGSQGTIGYTGSQGTLGYTGSQGAGFTGSQGTIGYTGSQGAIGYTGSQGVIGYTGSQGVQGPQGVGYTGSQGATGYTGSQGAIGYTGSQGATGYTGSQGAIGYTGSQGPIGYTGSQGATGYTGSQGAIGYTGSQGVQGPQGTTGYTGSQGATGYTGSQGVIGYTGSQGQGIVGETLTIGTLGTTNGAVVNTSSIVVGNSTSNALLKAGGDIILKSTDGVSNASIAIATSAALASFEIGGPDIVMDFKNPNTKNYDTRLRSNTTGFYIISKSTGSGFANNLYLEAEDITITGNLAVTGTVSSTGNLTVSGSTLSFNSGYGSAATAYGCRAWVKFSGSAGTISGDGNVTSVTDLGTGNFRVNFTTALVDGNYSATWGYYQVGGARMGSVESQNTTAMEIQMYNDGATLVDSTFVYLAVHR